MLVKLKPLPIQVMIPLYNRNSATLNFNIISILHFPIKETTLKGNLSIHKNQSI